MRSTHKVLFYGIKLNIYIAMEDEIKEEEVTEETEEATEPKAE